MNQDGGEGGGVVIIARGHYYLEGEGGMFPQSPPNYSTVPTHQAAP